MRYAKVVSDMPDSNQTYRADGEIMVSTSIITLQWRPTFNRWLVHGFGDYVLPEDLPSR